MKKVIELVLFILVFLMLALGLCSCEITITTPPCEHQYVNACDADCNICGQLREPSPHAFDEAHCSAPSTCSVCGYTEGEREPDNHDWNYVSAVNAVCTRCSYHLYVADFGEGDIIYDIRNELDKILNVTEYNKGVLYSFTVYSHHENGNTSRMYKEIYLSDGTLDRSVEYLYDEIGYLIFDRNVYRHVYPDGTVEYIADSHETLYDENGRTVVTKYYYRDVLMNMTTYFYNKQGLLEKEIKVDGDGNVTEKREILYFANGSMRRSVSYYGDTDKILMDIYYYETGGIKEDFTYGEDGRLIGNNKYTEDGGLIQ